MKQFKEIDSDSNLDRYVCESYHEVSFDFIKPIIEKAWENYMKIFGWTIDEIVDAYRKTKSDIGGIIMFDYADSRKENKFITKPRCAKIVVRGSNGEVKDYIECDQTVVRSPYFGTFSKNALTYLVVKRFPFLSELKKEEKKSMYVYSYLRDKKISEIPEEYKDKTLAELYSCYDKIEVTEVENAFSVYFKEYMDNLYFFVDYPKLSFIVDFKDLIDKNFDKIVEKDRSMQEMFIKNLTIEEMEERLNSRGMQMIREYCESK